MVNYRSCGLSIINKVVLNHTRRKYFRSDLCLIDCKCMYLLLRDKSRKRLIRKFINGHHVKHAYSAVKLMARVYKYYCEPTSHNKYSVAGSFGVMNRARLLPLHHINYGYDINNNVNVQNVAKLAEYCLFNCNSK